MPDQRFYVQFNPSELSIDEAIGVSELGEDWEWEGEASRSEGDMAKAQRPMQSTSARKRRSRLTLSTTLFFNTLNSVDQTSYEDVRDYVSQLYPYTNRGTENDEEVEQIYFFWGSIAVAGILSRMHVNYVMFAPDGKPVRAQVDISITGEYVGDRGFHVPAAAKEEKESHDTGTPDAVTKASPGWREEYKGTGNPRK